MAPKYQIKLTHEEREKLMTMTRHGKTQARKFIRARALLLCDAGADGPAWNVGDVAAALGIACRTIAQLKKRFVEQGLEAALEHKKRGNLPRELSLKEIFGSKLVALACSEPPEGHRHWTLRLLAEKAIELNWTKSLSHMTVQRILKKAKLRLRSTKIPKSRLPGTRSL